MPESETHGSSRRTEAIKVLGWVDQDCGWVDVGLTEEDEILILRDPLPGELEMLDRAGP
jgi:hypothetical protein